MNPIKNVDTDAEQKAVKSKVTKVKKYVLTLVFFFLFKFF